MRTERETNPNFAIVADSTTSLHPRTAKKLHKESGIWILTPNSWITIDGQSKRDFSLSPDKFYDELGLKGLLETANANTGQYERAFKVLIKKGITEILSVHSDLRLTGGINSAKAAAEEIKKKHPDTKIELVDTESASAGAGILVLRALELANEGLDVEEVAKRLEAEKENVRLLVALSNAKFFYESAKRRLDLGSFYKSVERFILAGAIGLLNILPIISLEEGEARFKGKGRGKGKTRQEIIRLLKEEGRKKGSLKKVIIVHTGDEAEAKKLALLLKDEFDIEPSGEWEAGTVLGVYAGKGAFGLAAMFE